jgi:di/tricarboxylate transporter
VTTEQMILFALFAGVFALMLWGRWRYDLVAFTALLVGVVVGVVPVDAAFSGFGHPATIIVAVVLVVSAGLVRSGAVYLVTRTLVDSARPAGGHIAVMGGTGAFLSAFMNNVAALALLMPVDVQTARKAGRPVRVTLMALSFATILGGLVTLIGTPPNIIVSGIREDTLGTPFAMFDFAPVGGLTALAGLAFVALVGWRLIPEGAADDEEETRESAVGAYAAELVVPADGEADRLTAEALREAAEDAGVRLLGLVREGKRRRPSAFPATLSAGDILVVEAVPEAIDEFRAALALDFPQAVETPTKARRAGLALVEAVVPADARIAGKTARAVGLAWRRKTTLAGIARRGWRGAERLERTVIRPGDVILLLTPEGEEDAVVDWLGCLPLADRGLVVTDHRKVWTAIGLFAGVVALASLGLIYLPVALALVVVGYVLTGILPLGGLYDHIEWPVVILLGSLIPLGAALDASGGTALIAGSLNALTESQPAWVALVLLMVVTMTLSDVLNNAATAVVAAPVGIRMAEDLGVSADPFLMAVAVAASCAFLTPIGHQNNTLILGPGGYAFGDYWRMGLPLEAVVVAVSVPAILVFWPL